MDKAQVQNRGFCGTLQKVQLTDLVQLACLAQMSHVIRIESGEAGGVIHVNSGQVCHAATEDLQGEEAFYRILLWESGAFHASALPDHELNTISRGWEYLLIEALRRRNEKGSPSPEESDPLRASPLGFAGTLCDVPLVDVVQLGCMTHADHALAVTSDQGTGHIYIRSGQVFHAQTELQQGEEAFHSLAAWGSGRFEALPLPEAIAPTIHKPWEYLLIEAMRFRDEQQGKGGEGEEETGKTSLLQRLQRMKVAEKIRLAMSGDKELRTMLIRDSNRMVQFAILSNPRITEAEIALIAYSRQVDEEVLRKIANNREWIKLYPIRLALTKNPKTPLAIANKLVQTLVAQDLKQIAKSKSVPSAVAQAARRLLQQKE